MTSAAPRIFAFGDIHGCHRKLAVLLHRLPYDPQRDTLVFLGDYINRGPESRQVLETLLELERTCQNTVFLMGNHEQALLDYTSHGDPEALRGLRAMGIETTVESYNSSMRKLVDLSCMPIAHRDFLRRLQFSYLYDDYVFTHADISEEMQDAMAYGGPLPHPNAHDLPGLLASRRLGREDTSIRNCRIIFGHLPFRYPLVREDRIGIDTGAVYGNLLTAVELPRLQFFHA